MSKDPNNRRSVRTAMLFCCVFMFSFSVSSSVYNTLAPFVIEHFGITLTQSSWISVTSSVGNLAINFFIMRMGDRFDKAKLLAVLVVLLGGSLSVIGHAGSMGVYLVANCVNGMVSWWVDNLTTSYVSDLYGERRDRYIGILYTLFAVGSTAAPVVNDLVLEGLGLSWQYSYRILGYFILAAAAAYAGITLLVKAPVTEAQLEKRPEERQVSVGDMMRNRNMMALVISGVTMAFYSYFSYSLPTFFRFTRPEVYTTGVVTAIATASAVGSMISRILYVPLAPRLDPIRYLRFQALFCTCCNLLCLLVNRPAVWIVLEFLSGLINSSSYTMTIVLTCNEYPDCSSSANAACSFASGIAYLFATPAINLVAERVSFFIAMLVPIAFGFITYFIYRFLYVEKEAH